MDPDTAVSTEVVKKKKNVKACATIPKGSLGNTQQISIKAQNPYCPPSQVFAVRSRYYGF